MASFTPISFSNMATNGVRLDEMISMEIFTILRDTANLRNTPYLTYVGSINGSGSDTIRVRLAGFGGTKMASVAEGAPVSASNFEATYADVVVARQALVYELTDLGNMTAFGANDINPFSIAASMAAAYDQQFMALTVTAAGSFTASKGSNATELSVDDFMNAIYQLESASSGKGVTGGYAMVMHSKALTELQDSLRDETSNAIQLMPAAGELLKAKQQGYAGQLMAVDLWKTSHLEDNGSGGYNNFMFSQGALGYADGSLGPVAGGTDMLQAGPVSVEISRTPQDAKTVITGHGYLGIKILQDALGTLVLSST